MESLQVRMVTLAESGATQALQLAQLLQEKEMSQAMIVDLQTRLERQEEEMKKHKGDCKSLESFGEKMDTVVRLRCKSPGPDMQPRRTLSPEVAGVQASAPSTKAKRNYRSPRRINREDKQRMQVDEEPN